MSRPLCGGIPFGQGPDFDGSYTAHVIHCHRCGHLTGTVLRPRAEPFCRRCGALRISIEWVEVAAA